MEEYSSKDLDHLGLVSTMCDEIRLVETIDELIPPDPRVEMSVGESVKLMVINGLGFSSKPLYLESLFFASKPVARLLGREIESERITDDRLGRSLDTCFKKGCDLIFSTVASKAITRFGINTKFRHLDSTSMSVHGEYDQENSLGLIQFGHSKDNNPDLKQFMVSLMTSRDGDVPLLAKTIAGNTSDKTHFKDVLKSLTKETRNSEAKNYFVADSALYTSHNIKDLSDEILWVTRVPESIKQAKTLVMQTDIEQMMDLENGYYVTEVCSKYGDVRQRWLVIFSQKAFERESKTLERQISKQEKKDKQALRKLKSEGFSCKADAQRTLDRWQNKLKYHSVVDYNIVSEKCSRTKGRPKKDSFTDVKWKIQCLLTLDQAKVKRALKTKGKFIIATNQLDHEELSNEELLCNYKEQQSVERGFRFLKDPLFMTSSVFLKKEERIVALGMIMCLCLMVYTLTQRHLRLSLTKLSATVPDQKGKPSSKPTMRWIYQLFEGVHVLYHKIEGGVKQLILNLNEVRISILSVLGAEYEKIYSNLN